MKVRDNADEDEGIRQIVMAVQRMEAWEEIEDFLTSSPSPQQIVTFRLSENVQARLHYLLEQNRENKLNLSEREELDQLLEIDAFMSHLKIKAYKNLNEPEKVNLRQELIELGLFGK